jgi:hypothetical protein
VVNLGVGISCLAAVSACAVPRSCTGGIFTDTARPGSVDPDPRSTVRRARRVEIDFGRVFPGGEGPSAAGAAERLTLNLFPDVCLIALRERVTDLRNGKVQWEGRVPGASPGTVSLIIDSRLMVGTLRIDREVYEIRYLGDGVHVVTDVDPSKFPRD